MRTDKQAQPVQSEGQVIGEGCCHLRHVIAFNVGIRPDQRRLEFPELHSGLDAVAGMAVLSQRQFLLFGTNPGRCKVKRDQTVYMLQLPLPCRLAQTLLRRGATVSSSSVL